MGWTYKNNKKSKNIKKVQTKVKTYKIHRNSVICLVVGIILFLGMELIDGENRNKTELKRNSYGEGEAVYELEVRGIDDVPILFECIVNEQIYTEQTIQTAFQEEYERLCQDILGDNLSLQEVRYPLALEQNKENAGILFSWKSSRPEVLSDEGKILLSYQEESQEVDLTVHMKAGVYEKNFMIPVLVYPPLDSKDERFKEFQTYLQQEEKQQEAENTFQLPMTFQGKQLSYQIATSKDSIAILFVSCIVAVVFHFEIPIKEREQQKIREQQMNLDYAEIVSKLLVFLGAGFSVRGAWERIVVDYEKKRKQNKIEERYAYEEMKVTYSQITSGMYEYRAYGSFGRRCGLHCYIKLGCLLEQNLRTGNKNLRDILEQEMESALKEKVQTAKKLGEEAGTKLVIPMVLLMAVVMVMVVVPAFMAL